MGGGIHADADNSAVLYNPTDLTVADIGSATPDKVQEAYQQLASLNKVLAENKQGQNDINVRSSSYENALPYLHTPSVDAAQLQRLENLNQLSSEADEPDSEMLALNTMLDKVLDIQHPERWKNRGASNLNGNDSIKVLPAKPYVRVAPISVIGSSGDLSLSDTLKSNTQNAPVGFYGLSNHCLVDTSYSNMQAVIYRDQEIVSGATVQLMLSDTISVNGVLIPKNTFVFGQASLQGERLEIHIPSIQYRGRILPVRIAVYDLDGLKGIYIPGTINRDGTKQGADRAIQSFGLSSLNSSVSGQAAAAGIETAKSLLSKKVKLIRVELKAGYRVLLFDENRR